ncbi:MAG: type II toxin-antitoxin system RelE/ParE family toxin [Methyloceanibacter sp.]|nr:type II toxin-antitoxin system RelE/ParE family toxin [Methyloceanibacter sp.]
MRIVYSPRAASDLSEIGDYLSERSPAGAAAGEQRIRTVVELIAHFPVSGRRLEERPAVSVIPLGNYPYKIFYTTSDDALIVLHIRHSARKPAEPGEL